MSESRSSTHHQPDDRADPEIFGRFLAGEATADERLTLERWATTPQRRRLLAAKYDDAPPPIERTDRAWAWLQGRVGVAEPNAGVAGERPGRRPPSWVRWGMRWTYDQEGRGRSARLWRSFALASAVAAGCLLWIASAHLPLGSWTPPGAQPARVFATGAAQRAVVTLSDGTQIMLDAGTRLRVAGDFVAARRVDLLDGEAQFTVTHRGGVPFVVRSGAAQVTVLGTTFAVRRSVAEGRSRVVVVDGRVALRALRHGVDGEAVLGAGMLAEVADTDAALVVTPDINVNDYTDWTHGRLVFRDTPLRQAIPELERRYGLVIRLADPSLGDQAISATMSEAPVGDVLDLLAMSFGMHYTREGNTVTFFRAHPNPPRPRQNSPLRSETTYGK